MRRFYCTAAASAARVPQNLVEKIVQRYAVDGSGAPLTSPVRSGDFVSIKPHRVMTHDNTAAVIPKFESLGAGQVFNAKQPFFGLDHDVQNKSEKNLSKYRKIEAFAKKHGITFSGAGKGIAHQVLTENGLAFPGTLVVASDSHSNMYGGVGCLGTPVVRTDAAAVWATGQTWWTVPPVTKVQLLGKLPEGCTGKDIIVTLCGVLNHDEVLNHAVEFSGPGVAWLSIDERLAIANMTTEWGALAGVFPVDEILLDWLIKRQGWADTSPFALPEAKEALAPERLDLLVEAVEAGNLSADDDAVYSKVFNLDLSKITPSVSGPNTVKTMTPASVLEERGVPVHKAYIVSCVNSRASDLKAAADVFRSQGPDAKVAEGVELYVAPASQSVKADAEAAGDWQVLLDAGAHPLPAGCGPCVGLGAGLLEKGQTGISATNRNFKGRMGDPEALCYLSSPAVVAMSALKGRITAPSATPPPSQEPACYADSDASAGTAPEGASPGKVALIPGFEAEVCGGVVFLSGNNLNTDGIYAGKHTYSDLEPSEMAKVAMENYDPAFDGVVSKVPGCLLVGGFNFGCGSSREQAATCLKYKGIKLVIAGSFSETYKRNAFNNGLAVLEAPELVQHLQRSFGASAPTIPTGIEATIRFESSSIALSTGETFPVSSLGPFAQEILLAGGLEGWVKNKLA